MKRKPPNFKGANISGLPWFENGYEKQIFKKLAYSCVYTISGPEGKPTSIGWTSNLPRRLADIQDGHWDLMTVHDLVWVAGPPLAKRLRDATHQVLLKAFQKRLREDWFDVTVTEAMEAIIFASKTDNISRVSHQEMLQYVAKIRQDYVESRVKSALS